MLKFLLFCIFTILTQPAFAQLGPFKGGLKNMQIGRGIRQKYRVCITDLKVKNPAKDKLWDENVKNAVKVAQVGLTVAASVTPAGPIASYAATASTVLTALSPLEEMAEDAIDSPDLYVEFYLGSTLYLRTDLVKNTYETQFKNCALITRIEFDGKPVSLKVFDLDVRGKDFIGELTLPSFTRKELDEGVNLRLSSKLSDGFIEYINLVIIKDN
jgi:hypothetical protein